MQADPVSAMAGVLLSLGFSYAPGARDWFGKLTGTQKRLVMLGLCLVVVLVEFGLACTGFAMDFGVTVTCDRTGAVQLTMAFIGAVIANQATFLISPKLVEG